MTTCDVCGQPYEIGDWPWCPHGKYLQHSGFEPHFDTGLGKWVNGWGDVKKAMRENHLDYRDHMSAERQEARRERIEAHRKAKAA